ncbi:hypothetical protein RJ639_047015 [Escallonia herrerae]|uniref:protein-serine/threonine phosphatase n=1 Tax=Escallonia herrerae TaxID=1293975 RepID=A0AA88W9Z7_9ASTE|nr:hypothetical protein RJ639_047015 [Escallonia herrerae]
MEVSRFRRMKDDGNELQDKCRERRRRRIEMRRLAGGSGSGSSSADAANFAECKKVRTGEEASGVAADASPMVGTMSVAGRLRDMEDAISVRPNLCRPGINRCRPVHFFGVYDGHGGPHVAALCRERMHVLMEEELMRVGITGDGESGGGGEEREELGLGEEEEAAKEKWRNAVRKCFERMDQAVGTCVCGSEVYECRCHTVDLSLSGSTAVVAILTPEHIVVGNVGDSRAVLCRAGRAVPLSFDHKVKPDREDELARIRACGGRVVFYNGARVEGILAMSRAIGDKFLKAYVTSEPEISFTRRDPEDECLILASDGLWDVLSNDLACEIACECLREKNPDLNAMPPIGSEGAEALYPSRSASTAALLTRLALGRKSSDNISVIVVDLKS